MASALSHFRGMFREDSGSLKTVLCRWTAHGYIRGGIIAFEKLEIDILLNIINVSTHLFGEFIYLQTVQKAITVDQHSNVINI